MTDKPDPPKRMGRPKTGREPRRTFTMMLNSDERDIIRIVRLHHQLETDTAAIRLALKQELARIPASEVNRIRQSKEFHDG